MHLDPKQKKIVAAVGAGGALALVVLLSRRSDTSTEAPATDAGLGTVADPGPSSFADNGAGFGQLSTSLSDGLGQVSSALAGMPTADDYANAVSNGVNQGIGDYFAAHPNDPPAMAAPGQLSDTGDPTASTAPKAVSAAFTNNSGNARSGRQYIVTTNKKGQTVHAYESAPGKADFGKSKNSSVVLKPPAAKKPPPKPPAKPAPTRVAQSGANAGQSYRTVVAHGTVYHKYADGHSVPIRKASK